MSDAIVIGAGLAGASAALRLARAGRQVVLIDKAQGAQDKVCGEFLSAVAQRHLAELGLDLPALGAVPIDRLRLTRGARSFVTPLGFTARSLSRRILDGALLEAARHAGVQMRLGCKARDFHCAGDTWVVETEQGSLRAPSLFLATGKHDMRAMPRPATELSGIVAFKTHLRLSPRQTAKLDRQVELLLFEGGYAGLEMIEDGKANLCLVASRALFDAAGKSWDGVLAHLGARQPLFAARLKDAESVWNKPLAIAGVPYGFVHEETDAAPDFYRLGDQMAVIPSFCGDGMSIALHSAHLATAHYLSGEGEAYHRHARAVLRPNIARAARVARVMGNSAGQAVLFHAGRMMPGLVRRARDWMQLGHVPGGGKAA